MGECLCEEGLHACPKLEIIFEKYYSDVRRERVQKLERNEGWLSVSEEV